MDENVYAYPIVFPLRKISYLHSGYFSSHFLQNNKLGFDLETLLIFATIFHDN